MSVVSVLQEVSDPVRQPAVVAKVADVIVSYLAAEGVTCVFGVPGGNLVPYYEALADSPTVQPVLCKHEEGGACMADGYARVSHRLGACCGIAGPGATHALTAIAGAQCDSVPVFFLSGQVATSAFGRGAIQDGSGLGIDLVELFRPVTKLSTMIVHPDAAPRIMELALRTAWMGRPGPVHVNLPCDVATMPVSGARVPEQARYRTVSQQCDFLDVARAASQLERAERPAILAGNAINLTGAWDELRYLAEGAGIPVATTPKGKGAFPENHPLSLGVFGFGGHQRASTYLTREADALLVIGSSLGEFETNAWDSKLGAGGPIIQIDVDPTNMGRNYPTSTALVSDARMAIVAIDAELSKMGVSGRRRASLPPEILEVPRWFDPERMESPASPIKPQRLVTSLRRVLPDDALVFVDIGNCLSWMIQYFEVREPGTCFLNLGFASMGWSGPASIGGQLAAPDRTVVAVMGDGAFAMLGTEIHTAVEYGLPVIWIVLNDGGFGMVEQGEMLIRGRSISPSRYRRPLNAAAMAEALGATGFRVDSPGLFEDAVREALRLRSPCLIDARIESREIPGTLRMRTESLRRMFDADVQQGKR